MARRIIRLISVLLLAYCIVMAARELFHQARP